MTNEFLEALAALEHDQWVQWSKSIVTSENISYARLIRWQVLWKPYSELSEIEKEQDRLYARLVLQLIDKFKSYDQSQIPPLR